MRHAHVCRIDHAALDIWSNRLANERSLASVIIVRKVKIGPHKISAPCKDLIIPLEHTQRSLLVKWKSLNFLLFLHQLSHMASVAHMASWQTRKEATSLPDKFAGRVNIDNLSSIIFNVKLDFELATCATCWTLSSTHSDDKQGHWKFPITLKSLCNLIPTPCICYTYLRDPQ